LARHRPSGSTGSSPAVQLALRTATVRCAIPDSTPERPGHPPVVVAIRGAHRVPAPAAALRGRIVVAAAAAGAFVAAGQSMGPPSTAAPASADIASADLALAAGSPGAGSPGAATGIGGPAPVPQVLTIAKAPDPVVTEQLAKGQRLGAERAARAAQARQPLFVAPAKGTFTSGFGARWGTQHLGIDIANSIGTPIVSVADGTVIEAGPASGFGLWVQVRHADGTITVFGHVNELLSRTGDRVKAGQEIATIGNRGVSTGPHVHLEVWLNGSQKVDPQAWLAARGVIVG